VSGVAIDAVSDANPAASTDGSGYYALTNLMGAVTVRPLPKFAAGFANDTYAVNGRDSQLIAQHVVHLGTPLTGKQQLAADASGNGVVSAYDAGLVSQFAIASINHLPVATAQSSDWKFLRCDNYPNCAPVAEYSYPTLSQNETANFYAVFYGDVSGNWQSSTLLGSKKTGAALLDAQAETDAIAKDRLVASRLASRPRAIRPQGMGAAGLYMESEKSKTNPYRERTYYVSAQSAVGIQGLDLTLDYDHNTMSIVDVRAIDQDSGFNAVWTDTPGSLKIAFFGYLPLEGDGRLLAITVRPKGHGAGTPFRINRLEANEGAIVTRVLPPGRTLRQLADDSPAPAADTVSATPEIERGIADNPSIEPVEAAAPTSIAAPSTTAARVYVETSAPIAGSRQRKVFVSASDSRSSGNLDLTFDYDPSKLSIVDVKAADGSPAATWHTENGSLQVAFRGGIPSDDKRLLEITVEPTDGNTGASLSLRTSEGD
jgi:hypothetical protein